MKQSKIVYTAGTWSVGVILGLMAACAGGDTPARTPELVEQIAVMYAGAEPTGAAAAGGGAMTGSGGSQQSGSGGSTAVGNGGSGSAACDGFAILKTNCGGSVCHDQQNSSPGSLSNFVLDETTAAAFVDEQSDQCASTDNSPIFDAQNPAASLVVKKITATTACGVRMPLGAQTQKLTDAELTCVKTWIASL